MDVLTSDSEEIDVVVEDETFKIKAGVMRFASPVLTEMLVQPMKEGSTFRIDFPTESKEEFMIFKDVMEDAFGQARLNAYSVDFGRKVDDTNVDFLLEYFEEFQVPSSGKAACDKVLRGIPIAPPDGVHRLQQATTFALSEEQRKRCEFAILANTAEEELAEVAKKGPAAVTQKFLNKDIARTYVSGKKLRSARKTAMKEYREEEQFERKGWKHTSTYSDVTLNARFEGIA